MSSGAYNHARALGYKHGYSRAKDQCPYEIGSYEFDIYQQEWHEGFNDSICAEAEGDEDEFA